MATLFRQPFAPLDGTRLQTLTSLKNRQNAVSSTSPGKRKAPDVIEDNDDENVDPILFSKRVKGSSDSSFLPKDFIKPATFLLTKSASTSKIASTPKAAAPRPRSVLNPKSPASRVNTGIAKSSPLSAPAGRSPTRGKRSGLLSSRRRTAGPYSRIDPPSFGLGASSSPAPFSLDAALKGTIPSYKSRQASAKPAASEPSIAPKPSTRSDFASLHESDLKTSWFFEIHEDTAEQEMTNLLQHSTCTLDISSDEESARRQQRERAEGKENVPPVDDVSQTARPRAARLTADADDMFVEKERSPLGEMDIKSYFPEGCDETSVIIIPGDEEEEQQPGNKDLESAPEIQVGESAVPKPVVEDGAKSIDELLQKSDEPAPSAALLQPIEGTGESFEVWESSSAKDENENENEPVSPS
ncbi:hypothetical protein PG993_013713 [Apiospora rasikravindrae]|uniref:Thymidylate kinase n=1 Tax=Apiospora rasikravindrae TaxID=990691 RepID=A0ABR1RR69_9PEZI